MKIPKYHNNKTSKYKTQDCQTEQHVRFMHWQDKINHKEACVTHCDHLWHLHRITTFQTNMQQISFVEVP